MIPPLGELMGQVGSVITAAMVAYAMFQNYFPYELRGPIKRYTLKFTNYFYPWLQITFPEYQGDSWQRSTAFSSIERYLNANSTKQAKRLQANIVPDSEAIVLSMADQEEINDEYQGIKLHWSSIKDIPNRQAISFYPREESKRYLKLSFHKRYRDVIINNYLKHVLEEGKAITVKERQRKLYTNHKSEGYSGYSYKRSPWSHVVFKHPATFNTLAMDPVKKQEIIDDLITFTKAKDYYAKVGKAWKRGYLLYGPPGTGKSTMIAAMANLLKYDIYDLELTAVKDNTELRKLLIDTSSKAVIVIEDIDCSLDLTGQREKNKGKEDEDKKKTTDENVDAAVKDAMKKHGEDKNSQVTLSGLLNFIDGLWSACGDERIIIFTTNYVEKLDPALIRRGRMDKHIELSYCGFEAFKFLANNYLGIDSHELFATIKAKLEETKMTPADVAENLMPKSGGEDEEACLMRLVKALEDAKEEEKKKAEEEEKRKAEEEEKKKKAEEEEKKKKAEEEEKLKAEKLAKEEEEKKKEEAEKSSKDNEQNHKNKENGDVKSNGHQDLDNGVKENGEGIKA